MNRSQLELRAFAIAVPLALAAEQFRRGDGPAAQVSALVLLGLWIAGALFAGNRLAAAGGAPEGGADRLRRTVLYGFAWTVAVTCAAGTFHRLSPGFLTALQWILLAPWCLSGSRGTRSWFTPADALAALRRDPLAAIVLVAGTGLAAAHVGSGVLAPPHKPDDLSYHYVFPVEWALEGGIVPKMIAFGNGASSYHPKSMELVWAWTFLPLGKLVAVPLAQGALLLGLALTPFARLRRDGVSRGAAALTMIPVLLSPALLLQVGGGSTDLAAAFFLASALAAIRDRASGVGPSATRDLVTAVGLLIGTKSFGLLTGLAIVLPAGLVALLLTRHARGELRLRPVSLLAGLAVLFVLGGHWYARNLLETGNPLFPLRVDVAGIPLFAGLFDSSVFGGTDPIRFLQLLPWPMWIPIGVALLLLPWSAGPGRRTAVASLAAAVALVLVYWRAIPQGDPRFAAAGVPLLAVVLGPVAHGSRPRTIGVASLAAAAALTSALVPELRERLLPRSRGMLEMDALVRSGLAAAIVAGLGATAGTMLRGAVGRSGIAVAVLAGAAMLLIGEVTSDPRNDHASPRGRNRWEPWIELAAKVEPRRIAVAGTNQTLPAYGPDFRWRSRYVNVTGAPDDRLHDHARRSPPPPDDADDRFGRSCYREDGTAEAWIRNLEAAEVDVVAVLRMPVWLQPTPVRLDSSGFPPERAWADAHPDRFHLLHRRPGMRAYQFVGSSSAKASTSVLREIQPGRNAGTLSSNGSSTSDDPAAIRTASLRSSRENPGDIVTTAPSGSTSTLVGTVDSPYEAATDQGEGSSPTG